MQNKEMVVKICLSLAFYFVLSLAFVHAQENTLNSTVDSEATLRSLTLAPIKDNVSNIYANKVQEQIAEDLQSLRKWSIQPFKGPQEFVEWSENPALVKKTLQQSEADGLITGDLVKGPNGLTMIFSLYTKSNGLIFLRETSTNFQQFELKQVQQEASTVFKKLLDHLPYQGYILSRRGQEITVNLGQQDQLKVGDELTVVLITRLNRHPKFGFLLTSEKEVLGKIKVTKVDDTLSFGSIISERERGVVRVNSKVMTQEMVTYQIPAVDSKGILIPELTNRDDSQISFGNQPQEWLPQDPATFGKVDFLLGFGSITANAQLEQAGGLSSSSTLTPSLHLNGQIWLNSSWSFEGQFHQSVGSFQNPIPNGKPEVLSVSTSQYGLYVGRNFLLSSSFWGPKLETLAGFSVYKSYFDSANPVAFPESTYSGFNFGLRGSFPFSTRSPYSTGAELFFYINPTLSESPVTSGASSSSNINHFAVFGAYRFKEKTSAIGQLSFDLYSTTFNGSGSRGDSASSTSQRLTTLAFGIEHLF